MRTVILLLVIALFSSCASIPKASVDLNIVLMKEADRMHELNIRLVNAVFNEKSEKLDRFFNEEYLPDMLSRFKKNIPPGTDFNKEFDNIFQALFGEAVKQRNAMQSALEEQRIKLTSKLEKDYTNYRNASAVLHAMLQSAVKVNKSREKALNDLKGVSNSKLDLNEIEKKLDDFISGGLKAGAAKTLSDELDKLIK